MVLATERYCSPEEVDRNTLCLLDHIEVVQYVLRSEGFSEHAIDQAVTAVYRAAMPYITGRKSCPIKYRRAWVFKVARHAAMRAAKRDVLRGFIEPGVMADLVPTVTEIEVRAPFDLREALCQLTAQQRQAVELCFLGEKSIREAARIMGKSAGTVSAHLRRGKKRLKQILAEHEAPTRAA